MTAARQAGVNDLLRLQFPRAAVGHARAGSARELLRALCEQRRRDLRRRSRHRLHARLEVRAVEPASSVTPAPRTLHSRLSDTCTTWSAPSARATASTSSRLAGLLHSAERSWSTRAYPLHGIVDRIGAGDAFAAGMLHGLLSGFDPQSSVDFGIGRRLPEALDSRGLQSASVADIELLLSEQQRLDVRR